MNSGEKNARIVCRMKSVEATRVIPSRCATSAATVDLPVPVEPPISTIDRHVELLQVRRAAAGGRPRARPRLAEHLAREHVEALERRPTARRARRGRARSARASSYAGRPGRRSRSARAPSGPSSTAARRSPSGSGSPWRGCDITATPTGSERRAAPRRARSPTTSFAGEHDADAARERVLGDDVDRGGLHLDEVRVGLDRTSSRAARRGRRGSPRRARRRRRGARRRSRPAVNTATRPSSGSAPRPQTPAATRRPLDDDGRRSSRRYVLRYGSTLVPAPDDEHAPVDGDRRDRGAARRRRRTTSGARSAARRAPSATFETKTRAREPAARAAAADRRHARRARRSRGGRTRRAGPAARERDEVVDGRRRLDELGLGRAAAAHRDDDDVAVAREQTTRGAR